ncbi:MAG: alpha/beta fold hydrolase [Geminicoccaceae bacterium]
MPDNAPVELSWRKFGEGDAVVIMHGLLGSARNWQAIAKALAADHCILTVDLRNHGDSPWTGAMDYPSMGYDIIRLLDDHGIEQASLVGHSMGGKVAMTTALQHPGRVARLGVVDIAPVTYSSDFRGYLEAMLGLDLGSMSRRSDVETALSANIPEAAIRAFLAQNSGSNDDGLYWKSNLQVLLEELPTILDWPNELNASRYDGPSLFLRGGKSTYVGDADVGTILELFPSARIETIADAGHWVHAAAPRETIRALRELLAST